MITDILLSTLELAIEAFHQGDYSQAKQLYQQVLQQAPQHPDALHLLGLLEAGQGDIPTATALIQQAIDSKPEPLFYRNLGHLLKQNQQYTAALDIYQQWSEQHQSDDEAWYHWAILAHQVGQLTTAVDAWQHLLQRHPDSPETHNNLGNTQLEQGELAAAHHSYQQATQLNPNFTIGWYNLGRVCQQQGDFTAAWNCFQKALHLAPDFAEVHNVLGIWFQHQKQPEQAMAAYQQALHLNPEFAEAYNNLGTLYYDQKALSQAIDYFQQALQRLPNYAAAWKNLGAALNEQGWVPDALQAYERSLAIAPDDALEIRRAMLLPPIYESQTEVATWRQRNQDMFSQLQQRDLRIVDPPANINATSFYLPYQGLADRELQEQLAQICLQACPDLGFTASHVGKRQGGPLRLGFVSHHLRYHTIGKLMRGLIGRLSQRPEFELTVFFVDPTQDTVSNWIRERVHATFELPCHLQSARHQIAAVQPDILFYPDLGMDPLTYFLAFSRLATLQCTTWGHPITSGIPAMDAFFSSQALETELSIGQYSEQLIQLRHLIPFYDCPVRPPRPAVRSEYGLPEQAHLYVCAQSLFKFHPDFDGILGQILRQDSQGLIVLLAGQQPQWQTLLQQRWQNTLPDVQHRLVFVPRQNEVGYLNLLTLADVVLDPIHFGGGNTSYEAFAMGVPVVTWPSAYLKGRLTYAMCQQMDWMAGVAASPEEYVTLALRLGQDQGFNQRQREMIAACRHCLFQDEVTVSEVADSLYHLWEQAVG